MKTETPTNGYPLTWPFHRPRTPQEKRELARFKTTVDKARREILNEVARMGGSNLVISTNCELRRDGFPRSDREPADPGVAVYCVRKGRKIAFFCDRWRTVAANLWAIVKTIGAIRGIERWGSGEGVDAAFTGFAALPAAMTVSRRWWEVFGVADKDAFTIPEAESTYRRLCNETHPDRNDGRDSAFKEVQQAWDDFRRKRGLLIEQ